AGAAAAEIVRVVHREGHTVSDDIVRYIRIGEGAGHGIGAVVDHDEKLVARRGGVATEKADLHITGEADRAGHADLIELPRRRTPELGLERAAAEQAEIFRIQGAGAAVARRDGAAELHTHCASGAGAAEGTAVGYGHRGG